MTCHSYFLAGTYVVSPDGSVVLGTSEGEAFWWTEEGGIVGLGYDFFPTGLTADDSTIVGVPTTTSEFTEPVIWRENVGIRALSEMLTDEHGLDLDGWMLETVMISADGTAFAGTGTNPTGHSEAWVAVIPESPTVVLVVLGAGLVVLRRW